MRILFATDHARVRAQASCSPTHARSRGHEVVDLGPDAAEAVDYPDFAHELAAPRRSPARPSAACSSAAPASACRSPPTATPGVRAALCHDAFTAEAARRHNDANVLCLGGRTTGAGVALQILEIFLDHAVRRRPPRAPRREDRVAADESSRTESHSLRPECPMNRSSDPPSSSFLEIAVRQSTPRSRRAAAERQRRTRASS